MNLLASGALRRFIRNGYAILLEFAVAKKVGLFLAQSLFLWDFETGGFQGVPLLWTGMPASRFLTHCMNGRRCQGRL